MKKIIILSLILISCNAKKTEPQTLKLTDVSDTEVGCDMSHFLDSIENLCHIRSEINIYETAARMEKRDREISLRQSSGIEIMLP